MKKDNEYNRNASDSPINFSEKEKSDIIRVLNVKYASHVIRIFLTKGVEYYIDKWKEIASDIIKATDIKMDYSLGYEDFTDNLTTREILEDIIDTAKPKNGIRIIQEIQSFDDVIKSKITFVDLTKTKAYLHYDDKWVSSHPKEKYWWYWGKFPELKFQV